MADPQPFDLKLGSLDLAPFLRLAAGEGFDPVDPDFSEPQLSRSPLREGAELVLDQVGPKELVWPLALAAHTQNLVNLAPNPSAEETIETTGFAGSSAGLTAATYTRSTTWAKAGIYSRRHQFFRNDAGGVTPLIGTLPTGASGIPVTPGRYYAARLALYIEKMDVPIIALAARLYWYKADGTASAVTSSSDGPTSSPVLATEGSRIVVGLAPSDAAFVSLRLLADINPGGVTREFISHSDAYAVYDLGTTVYPVGSASVAADVPAYLDGDSGLQYGWDGQAHASTSRTRVGKDGLHRMVRTINRALAAAAAGGTLARWRDLDATNPSFFDVVAGRLEPDFNYRRSAGGWAQALLRLWVQPYAHTATNRIAATAAGSAVLLQVPVASIAGDVAALAVVDLAAESVGVAGLSVLPDASHPALFPAASLARPAGATLIGASGAAGSQAVRLTIGTSAQVVGFALSPTRYLDAQRILIGVRPAASLAAQLYGRDELTTPIGPTQVASIGEWRLHELGVMRPQPAVAGAYPTSRLFEVVVKTATYSPVATHQVDLGEVYVLPEGRTALLDVAGASFPASTAFSLDGVSGHPFAKPSGGRLYPLDGVQRGALPAISPGETVAVLVAPPAGNPGRTAFDPGVGDEGLPPTPTPLNQPVSVTVKVRERFRFAR